MLSGAIDLEKRPEPEDLKEPMRWLLRGFAGPGATRAPSSRPRTSTSCCRRPTALPSRPEPEPGGGDVQPELGLGTLPAPRALPVSRLSYSGLEDYRRCSYRFYLERALRLPRVESPFAAGPLARGRARRAAARDARARAARAARLRAAGGARGGRGGRADRGARRHRARRGGGRPARHGRALRRLRCCASGSRGRSGCAPSCRSPSRSRRPARAGAACSSTAWWTCTPPRADGLLVVDYKSDRSRAASPPS